MAVQLFGPALQAPPPHEVQALLRLFHDGDFETALAKAQALAQRHPKHPLAWQVAGAVLRARQQHEQALPFLRKAADLQPRDAAAHFNLANALRDLYRPDEAAQWYWRALKLRPDLPLGYFHLANMQQEAGQYTQAEKSFRKALELAPDHVETLSNLAHLLHDMGRPAEAVALYDQALAHEPGHAGLHYNRSAALLDLGQFDAAEAAARQALALAPGMASAHAQLGEIRLAQGHLEAAIEGYRSALALEPDALALRSSLLMLLSYQPSADAAEVHANARAFGRSCTRLAQAASAGPALPRQAPPLRVGLVSADLRNHPVGHFLESVLGQLDTRKIALVGLPTQRFEDALTHRIRPHFQEWHCIAGLPDNQAARAVRALGLHIVIDLAGHTAGNRLPLFAHRLAPVQATWLGYFATTGVAEMDYLIADPVSLPPALEAAFTERIWRLPDTRLCFTPPAGAMDVNPLPALDHGAITLGSLSNLLKLNDDVIALWSKVLAQVPHSRLLVQAKQLGQAAAATRLRERFARQGIDPGRLILEPPQARQDYLRTYHRVDFCLDPFPFPGGTTTAEALWMGVPVLTLQGTSFLGRQGASLLAAAGLHDWIAQTPHEYLDKAVEYANDREALARLRGGLRQQVQGSPLFDAVRFARHLESALQGMWAAQAG